MRRLVLAWLLLAATASCRRTEPPRTESFGDATLTSVRSCKWLDWENTSCRIDSVLTAGTTRLERVNSVSASPHAERLVVILSNGGALVLESRTGTVLTRLPVLSSVETWCGDAAVVVNSPLTSFGANGGPQGTTLEHVGFEPGGETHRDTIYRGLRRVPRVLCGPARTLALVLDENPPEAPIGLYHWDARQGLQLVEDWPGGRIEGGDASDLVLSWAASGKPEWCARSRPYSLGTCRSPARAAGR
ncbi:hypothetical protein LZ198_08040 [Myxococcus sp. K15C18031901]|uniref:hypothetical protein n=1 Tax=Myxococcus dinghuensis TaxID=2906761 RepID=UPI0020A7E273|nr:hypothetical protein [Myxococcus dinghuensis]MCP3098824.1 hypothetical protein [Myxococcus dinghuensis]